MLFERVNGKLHPTHAGSLVIAGAERIELETQDIERVVAGSNHAVTGKVRLTAVPLVMHQHYRARVTNVIGTAPRASPRTHFRIKRFKPDATRSRYRAPSRQTHRRNARHRAKSRPTRLRNLRLEQTCRPAITLDTVRRHYARYTPGTLDNPTTGIGQIARYAGQRRRNPCLPV